MNTYSLYYLNLLVKLIISSIKHIYKPSNSIKSMEKQENNQKKPEKQEINKEKHNKNECEQELETIKEKYQKTQEKYNLPTFEQLNADFDISKAECDTETILRDIRKIMIGKFSSWLNFIETLLNPTNGSMFHMYLVKSIGEKEKQTLMEIFSQLGEIEIHAIKQEINYNEEQEADFIRNNFKKWQDMKKPLTEIIDFLKTNWEQKSSKKEKSYFG